MDPAGIEPCTSTNLRILGRHFSHENYRRMPLPHDRRHLLERERKKGPKNTKKKAKEVKNRKRETSWLEKIRAYLFITSPVTSTLSTKRLGLSSPREENTRRGRKHLLSFPSFPMTIRKKKNRAKKKKKPHFFYKEEKEGKKKKERTEKRSDEDRCTQRTRPERGPSRLEEEKKKENSRNEVSKPTRASA